MTGYVELGRKLKMVLYWYVVCTEYMPASGSRENISVILDELSSVIDSQEDNALTIIRGNSNAAMGHLGGRRNTSPPTKACR